MRVGRRGGMVAASATAILSAALAIPAAAVASGPLGDLVDRVTSTVDGGHSSGAPGGGPTTQGGNPPDYVPPAHGTNPHGQGTVAVGDLQPEATAPLPYDPGGGSQDVVIGQARGEQTDSGDYHGHITIAALLGHEILGVDTNQGEAKSGPLQPIQDVLDQLCSGSDGQLCLTVLTADSATTGDGSTNSFEAVGAQIGGEGGINASVASSNGNISQSGDCQTSHGDSSVASADVGGQPVADVLQSSSDSQACRGSAPTQSNESTVLALGGNGLPLPVGGCADGTPNAAFTSLAPLVATVCNADDSNGAQAEAPYGVREALTAFVLESGDTSLLTATGGAAESRAVAPGASPPGCESPPCGGGDDGTGGEPPSGIEPAHGGGAGAGSNASGGQGNGAGPSAAGPGKGSLPFTGADLLRLLLVGLAVMATGLTAMALADRRRLSA